MKKVLALLAVAAMFTACTFTSKPQEETTDVDSTQLEPIEVVTDSTAGALEELVVEVS